MSLRAVIFDMDGVLCLTDEYHYLSWKRMTDGFGIPFNRQDNEKLRGLTRRKSLEVILGAQDVPEEQMLEMMAQKDRHFQDLIQQMTPAALSAGVGSLLKELREAGIKIGVASASRNVQVVLKQLGIDRSIDAFSDSNIVKRSKPAPDSFLRTAQMLGVSPSDSLAVEDSEAGIEAALTAGMCVIGLGPYERVKKAHAVFEDLSGVRLKDLQRIYRIWRDNSTSQSGNRYRFLSLP